MRSRERKRISYSYKSMFSWLDEYQRYDILAAKFNRIYSSKHPLTMNRRRCLIRKMNVIVNAVCKEAGFV